MADATTLSVLITARDQASAAFEKIEGNMGKLASGFQKHRKTIGIAMAGAGAAITGLAAMSVKSSLDQQQGINLLDAALKNVGSSYASNKVEIEKNITALQRKTNYGDEEQRKILTKLVGIIGDEEQAMAALPVVLDAAAFSGKEAGTVAETMSKFFAGLANTSDATGVKVDALATFEERLGAVMKVTSGSAEAAADPITQLGNTTGDLQQVIGNALLPILETLVPIIDKTVQSVQKWTEENPTLTKVLVIVATAVGGILLVVGPLLLILPTLIAGIGLVSTAFAALSISMGPITLIVIGISVAIAAAVIIWKKWEDMGLKLKIALFILMPVLVGIIAVIKNWDKIWATARKTTEIVFNAIIGFINNLGKKFAGFIDMVRAAMNKLPDFIKKMIPGFEAVEQALENVSATLEEGIPPIEIYNEQQEAMGKAARDAAEAADEAAIQQRSAITETAVVVGTETDKIKVSHAGLAVTVEEKALMIATSAGDIELAQRELAEETKTQTGHMSKYWRGHEETVAELSAQIVVHHDEIVAAQAAAVAAKIKKEEEFAAEVEHFAKQNADAAREIATARRAAFIKANKKTIADTEAARAKELEATLQHENARLGLLEGSFNEETKMREESRKGLITRSVGINMAQFTTGQGPGSYDAFRQGQAMPYDLFGPKGAVATPEENTILSAGALRRKQLREANLMREPEVRMSAGQAKRILELSSPPNNLAIKMEEIQRRWNISDESIRSVQGFATTWNPVEAANMAVLAKRFGWSGTGDFTEWQRENQQEFNAFLDKGFPRNQLEQEMWAIGRAVADRAELAGRELIGITNQFEVGAADALNIARVVLGQTDPSTLRGVGRFEEIAGLAHGGMIGRGGMALVGERGPELVSLPGGAFVHPSGTGPGGGLTNNFIFNGAVYGVDDLREVVVEAVRDHALSGGFSGVFGEP